MNPCRFAGPAPVARSARLLCLPLLGLAFGSAACASPGTEAIPDGAVEPQGATPADASFEAAVRRDLAASPATGAVFVVVDAGGVRLIEAVGHLEGGPAHPMTEDYLFHLGSWGNLLLASVALTLDEEGVLSLVAPLGSFVPDLPEGMSGVTLEQLLLETGGLDDSPLQTQRVGEPVRSIPPEEELGLLTDRVVMTTPGLVRSPSRHHWLLAGHAVETASGRPLEEIVERVLGAPLGLRQTLFAATDAVPPGAPTGFQASRSADSPYVPAPHPNPALLQPQERIWSTAGDLGLVVARWLAAPAHLVELARPRVADPADPEGGRSHALGFRVAPDGSWTAEGWGPGHSVVLRLFPASGVAVLAMSNGRESLMPRSRALVETEARAGEAVPAGELRALEHEDAPPFPLERVVQPLPTHAGVFRNGSEVFRLVVHQGRLAADPGLPEPLSIRVGEGGQLEAHLDDGRTAMVMHLFRDPEGQLLALYRGVVFRWESER